MFSSHTQSTYHNWIRSDYYTLSQILFIYKKTAPSVRFGLRKSHPMSNNYSYNSLYRHKLSGQSYTSPILRWTGNSPIWGTITVPTRGSSIYDSPQPTVRLDSTTKYTTVNLVLPRTCVPSQSLLTRERSTAWSTVI